VLEKRTDIKKSRQCIVDLPASADRAAQVNQLNEKIGAIQKEINKCSYDHAHKTIEVVDDKLERIENLAQQIIEESGSAPNCTDEAINIK